MVKKKEKGVEENETTNIDHLMANRLMIFGKNVIYTLCVIAIFGFAGYWLDQKFGTYPKLLIAAIVISYPFTQFILYRKWKKFAQENKSTKKE